jgi:endonuclease/exonuclease/phosphatase (EEP) superfamily protein YafD
VYVLPESFLSDSGPGMLDGLADAGYRVETMRMKRHEQPPSTKLRRGWRPSPGLWCLAMASRLPVVDRRELPMGKAFRDPAGPRFALRLDIDVEGRPVQVVGLHTSSKLYFGASAVHLAHLRRHLSTGPGPAIVAGDFNLWGPPTVAILHGWHRTVRGRTYPAHRPHSQIDHILVNRAVRCVEAEVLPEYGSDHRAVRARLAV